jgi:hypothetical protein
MHPSAHQTTSTLQLAKAQAALACALQPGHTIQPLFMPADLMGGASQSVASTLMTVCLPCLLGLQEHESSITSLALLVPLAAKPAAHAKL